MAALELVLYSRSNCPLCETMEDELRPFIRQYSITVKRHYIDNDPELEQRYGSTVPVLTLGGETLCEYYLNPESLLTVLSQEQAKRDILEQ
jgi:glutaredoxin